MMRRPVLSANSLLLTLVACALLPSIAGAWPSPRHDAHPIPRPGRVAHVDANLGRQGALVAPSFLTGAALLTGHAYDLTGLPLDGARVGWIVEGATTAQGSGRTNASGLYSLGSVPAAAGDGTVWCAPADGSWELARLEESWPDAGTTTIDFAPAGMPVSLTRGGPWKEWPSAWIQLSGSDERGAVSAGAEIEGVLDDDTYISPTFGTAATLPGVYDSAAVNFWANEGLEFTTVARSGPGSRRVQNPITLPGDFSFPDHAHGWVVGGTQVCRTTDAGRTWTTQYWGPAFLTSVAFADALHGIAVGALPGGPPSAFAMWTEDGGATWTPSQTSLTAVDYYQTLRDVECLDAQHAWAVGESGLIFATADGGRTWTPQASGTRRWLMGVSFADLQHGWASGQGDTILATTDGGLTWEKQHEAADQSYPEGKVLVDIDALDAQRAWAVGYYGTAFRTTDGGDTWQPMHPTAGGSTADDYNEVEFVDAQHGWLAGQGPGVMATKDGGLTWSTQVNQYATIIGIDMDGPVSGWVLGYGGDLVDTVDGGEQWGPRVVSASEADAQRLFTTKPWSASGAPGMSVTLDLQHFPANWQSVIYGRRDYPASAPVDSFGLFASSGAEDETVTVKVPATATPGYFYWLGADHLTGPLSLETAVQVCRFKSSTARVIRGRSVALSGIVPVQGHLGRTPGKAKAVYLFRRFTKRDQPTTGNPTRQGWKYVGKVRTNTYGSFSFKGVRISRPTWFVALYAGDSWYWPGYTGVVRVAVR